MAKGLFPILGLAFLVAAPSVAGDYTLSIQAGVTPRMSPSNVAALVKSSARARQAGGQAEPQVKSVECTDGKWLRDGYSDPGMRSGAPVWRVTVSGRFDRPATQYGHQETATSMTYVIDDETGELLAFGMSGGAAGEASGTAAVKPYPPRTR